MTAKTPMYGLVGKFIAKPGQRAALIAAVLEGVDAMPGCLAYTVSEDVADDVTIWITEVWDSKESHDASLKLPAVQASIAKGRPLIAGFEPGAEMRVIGGYGLPK